MSRKAKGMFERFWLESLKVDDDGLPSLEMWHGGAPNVDKFDMSKMGTGEGQQVYSPGLYNAERRGTATSYRDAYTAKLEKGDRTKYEYLLGGNTLELSHREWDQVKDVIDEPYKLEYFLTKELQDSEMGHLNAAEKELNYPAYKEKYDEEKGWEEVDRAAESHGELGYEEEMKWLYGDDWEPDPQARTWGFMGTDNAGEPMYMYVENNTVSWHDPLYGERTMHFPEGVDDAFIVYQHENDWAANLTERSLYDHPDTALRDRYRLAYEMEPNVFRHEHPNEMVLSVSAGGDVNPEYGLQPVSSRRQTADGRIIDEMSPEYFDHLRSAEIEMAKLDDREMKDIAWELKQGNFPVWNPANGPEPDFSAMKGGLYKTKLNVDPDTLLDWFEPIKDQPAKVKELISRYLNAKDIKDQDNWNPDNLKLSWDSGTKGTAVNGMPWLSPKEKDRLMSLTGQEFFQEMAGRYGSVNFRDDMASIGMPGILYRDWTRNYPEKRPTYNVVMYDDKPIDILERGAASAPMLASVFGITSAALATAYLNQASDTTSETPVLDPEIASRFPMPPEEDRPDTRSGLDKVLDHEGFLTPYAVAALRSEPAQSFFNHPVTKLVGNEISEGLDVFEYPARFLAAEAERMYNLSQDEMTDQERRVAYFKRLLTPHYDTAEDAGEAAMKATHSPLLATGAMLGTLISDPLIVVP